MRIDLNFEGLQIDVVGGGGGFHTQTGLQL